MARLTPELMEIVAERFRALGEPMRLRILDAISQKERTVGDLVTTTGATQANVSKHLTLLHRLGFVNRRKEGTNVYYALGDQSVFQICDLVCGGARQRVRKEAQALRS
jgi:DNA-binding transcriptional ArsR family regulator